MTASDTRSKAVWNGCQDQRVLDTLVVLGCRLRVGAGGRLCRGVLRGRVEAAASAFAERADEKTMVVTSGGRRWSGLVEADVIADELVRLGVPANAIMRERRSRSTRENARFAIVALASHRIGRAAVVTSDWHLPRALALFRCAGMVAEGIGASDPDEAAAMARLWRRGREKLLGWAQAR